MPQEEKGSKWKPGEKDAVVAFGWLQLWSEKAGINPLEFHAMWERSFADRLATAKQEGIQLMATKGREAIRDFLEKQNQKTFDLTMKGKNGPEDVSEADWQMSSFSFDDILAAHDQAVKEISNKE